MVELLDVGFSAGQDLSAPKRNYRWIPSLFIGPRSGHPAPAFEQDTFLEDHHGGFQVAKDAGGPSELHAFSGVDVAYHLTPDHHRLCPDRGVDDGFLANDERIRDRKFAMELAVDQDGPGALEGVLPLNLGAFTDEGHDAGLIRFTPGIPQHDKKPAGQDLLRLVLLGDLLLSHQFDRRLARLDV